MNQLKRMNIRLGIDIDGVISSQVPKIKEIAERHGITDHSYLDSYSGIYKTYSPDNKQLSEIIFGENLEEFLLGQEPMEGAKEGFEKILASDYINPYLVTSRHKSTEDLTMKWLEDHGFGGVDVLFLQDKLEAPTNVLVDDLYSNVKKYTDNARMGFLMDAQYNRKYNVLRRVSNLTEVYQDLLKYL